MLVPEVIPVMSGSSGGRVEDPISSSFTSTAAVVASTERREG